MTSRSLFLPQVDFRLTQNVLRSFFAALLALMACENVVASSPVEGFTVPEQLRPVFPGEPKDSQLTQVRLFSEALAPMEVPPVEGENAALGRTLEKFSKRANQGDVAALEAFLAEFPKSRWCAAIYLNAGMLQYGNGAFSQALNHFDRAWNLSKSAKSRPATSVRDRAAAEAGRMNARLGNRMWLDNFIAETNGLDITGSAGEMLQHTREATSMMHAVPEKSFMCGPYALLNILPQDVAGDVKEAIRQPQSSAQGTSLAQVLDLAKKTGKNYQVAFRSPGSPLIVPAVVHWNVGHFAALTSTREGGAVSQDPTFGDEVFVSTPVLDQEASGYFLIPEGPLPAGWRPVPTDEAATIWGKGITTGKNVFETSLRAVKCKTFGPCAGMATYNVQAMLVGLTISDAPVGYRPAFGPDIAFMATYSQRDVAQPDTKNYSNLGLQWTHNWLSFLTVSGTTATIAEAGGGALVFSGFNSATGLYTFDSRTTSSLQLVSTGRYERTFANGAKEVFSAFDGVRYFLTSKSDPAGRAVTLAYDASFRLTGISDAAGLVTTISYQGDDYKIQTVTDPFGRTAFFAYDEAGRLTSITDTVGIVSSFVYEGTGSFIKSMTTPYGTTNFSFADSEQDRWFEARDPDGNIERTEYRSDTPSISEEVNTIPAAVGTSYQYYRYRNTFYWDKKAYAEGRGDFTKAHIFHWLHEPPGYSLTSGVLESEKTPFESRVCYLYYGMTFNPPVVIDANTFTGSPDRILRKLTTGTAPEDTQKFERAFNALGLPTKSIDPAGRETRYTYAANNVDVLAVDRKNGANYERLATYTYDTRHLPLTATDASGQTTQISYNTHGQVETVTNPLSKTTSYNYDAQGRLTSVDGPLAGDSDKISFTYDPIVLTRVKTVTDPDGATTTYEYDALDRVTKVTYPDATYEQVSYSRLDPEWLRDRAGRWSRLWHNALRQRVAVMDPAQRTTGLQWCKCGDLKSITDANNHRTLWKHDVAGRIWEKEYADGSKEQYFYDLAGRLDHVIDPAGKTRSFAYKVDDNIASLTYPSGNATASVSFSYGTLYNRMESMTDTTGVTAFSYNPITSSPAPGAGRLAGVDGPLANDTITYQYDPLGRVVESSLNGVARNFVFGDDLGRLTRETNALGQFDYTYDGPTGRLATATAPNGVVSALTYFALPHDRILQSITHTGPGSAAISTFSYEYDALKNIKNWTQTQASNTLFPTAEWNLEMDLSNQLTGISIAGQPALAETFGYDNGGNRLTRQLGNQVATTSYNNLNQIGTITGGGKLRVSGTTDEPANVTVQGTAARMLSATNFVATPSVTVGTNVIPVIATDGTGNSRTNSYQVVIPSATERTFAYDLNVNLLSDGTRTYEWDGLDRLVKVTQGVDVYAFAYDGMNRRVSETKNGTLTKRFVWDGLTLAEERDAANNVLKRFLPQGEMQGTAKLFYARDHLGSVRDVTDATGVVVSSYTYDAWGKRTLLAGTDLASAGYTGHYTHTDTSLVMAPFRAYDPETGRWLSRDPIGEDGGINLYGYVSNNPVNFADLLGLWVDVPDSMRNEYDAAKEYLRDTPAGDKLNALEMLPQRIELRRGNSEAFFKPDSNAITWDPYAALSTSDGRGLSPALVLAHEADHAVAFNTDPASYRFRMDPTTGALSGGWTNKEEARVIRIMENATSRMKGEGVRNNHQSGDMYKVNCPTSRVRVP